MSSYIKKIKISLEYNNNPVLLDVEPYRQIKYLKEKAGKIFYPLNYEIRLIYNNKDLLNYENMQVGEYFKNKGVISIKVVQLISLAKLETENKGN
jgi:hypothetical protein